MPFTPAPTKPPKGPLQFPLTHFKPTKKPGSKPGVGQHLPILGLRRPSAGEINRSAPPVPPNISINSGAAYQPIAPLYGATRVVGKPALIREKSGFWVVLYVFGRGPWENIDTLYINNDDGTDVSSNSGGATFTNSSLFGTGGSARIFEGSSGQDVGSDFLTAFVASFTDALDDPGIVCIGTELSPHLHREPPRIEADCQGVSVFDPRTSSTAYSNNAALVLADYITNSDWGHNATIDWDSVATCADNADDALGSGVRFTTNLLLNRLQSTRDWIRHLQIYAGCFVQELGGTFTLIPDRPATKVFDVGPNIGIERTGSLRKGLGRNSRPSDVVAVWFDTTNNVEKEAFAIGGTTGQVSRIRVPGITDYETAHRFAIGQYNHLITEDLSYSRVCRDEALQFELGDVHAITDTMNGLDDKYMRLMGKRMLEPGRWACEWTEYQEAAYSDSVDPDGVTVDTTLPNPNSPPTLTGVTATGSRETTSDGSEVIQISVTWTDPAWLFTDYIHVYVEDTDQSPDQIISDADIPPDKAEAVFRGLLGNTNYKVYARIVSRSGAVGTYATDTEQTPRDTTDPGAPSSVTISWFDSAEEKILVEADPGTWPADFASFFLYGYAIEDTASPPNQEAQIWTAPTPGSPNINSNKRFSNRFLFDVATDISGSHSLDATDKIKVAVKIVDRSSNSSSDTESNQITKS